VVVVADGHQHQITLEGQKKAAKPQASAEFVVLAYLADAKACMKVRTAKGGLQFGYRRTYGRLLLLR
jgi:hypothetical protein